MRSDRKRFADAGYVPLNVYVPLEVRHQLRLQSISEHKTMSALASRYLAINLGMQTKGFTHPGNGKKRAK